MHARLNYLLKEYGLDNKEIRIYLLLVGNIELTAYAIAKKTGIHRSTTYDVLERLISKGFVSRINKNDKIYYEALEISEVISKLKDKESILSSIIPEFEKIKSNVSSRVRILESENGQKQFNYNLSILIEKKMIEKIYAIGNGHVGHTSSQLFLERLLKEAKKKKLVRNIKYKGIWNEKFRNGKLVKLFSTFGEDRFLENIPTNVTTVIFGDFVAYLFTLNNKPQVIEIQNKLIAEENKAYFEKLWQLAKK